MAEVNLTKLEDHDMTTLPILTAILSMTAAAGSGTSDANGFAIKNVRVFDGERTIVRATVLVEGGVIAAVGDSISVPTQTPTIDGTGKTVIPGLIDSHVHVFPGAQADALRFGVTTVLDMFHGGKEFAQWKAQRESLAKTAEADTWSSSVGVTVPGGHPTEMAPPNTIPTVGSVSEVRPFVDARVAEGADYVKLVIDPGGFKGGPVFPTLSDEEVRAVAVAAHANHRLAIAHVTRQSDAKLALEQGVDGLAHTWFDGPLDLSFVQSAARRGAFFISTLSIQAGISGRKMGAELMADPRVAPYLSGAQRSTIAIEWTVNDPSALPNGLAAVRAMHAAGGRVLAGDDAPAGTAHGVTMHGELRLLTQAGYTPEEALTAATALPARVFWLDDRGRIAPGMRADLVLIDGDPTSDITKTLSISRIWKNGYEVDRTPPASDTRGASPR
jgi:imidazolonepropionase-like amidohydrolase